MRSHQHSTLNRSEKRITVVFRGSVSLKDWITDANMSKVNPEEVKAFAGESVFMHEGFCGEYCRCTD